MTIVRRTSVLIGVLIALIAVYVWSVVLREDAVFRPPPNPPHVQLPPAAEGTMDFEADIRPILSRNCHACHGAKTQQGQLRLDVKAKAVGKEARPGVIVPGNAGASRLIELVAAGEMPPPPKRKKLSDEEIGKLIAWIDQGAVWPDEKENPPESSP